ncbi:MAG: CoA-binding protein [Desulfobacterales bacterium]|nr:CoA-binding protein [Desulfobacterales bacterium]
MKSGKIITEEKEIREILKNSSTIAVIGLSTQPDKASYRVAKYLKDQGYRIIPIHPNAQEILGEKVSASLDDIKEPVDIVDVFRKSEQILPHAKEAVRLKPKVFWMQLNIENQAAAELLVAAGINVIMNQCLMVQHKQLIK